LLRRDLGLCYQTPRGCYWPGPPGQLHLLWLLTLLLLLLSLLLLLLLLPGCCQADALAAAKIRAALAWPTWTTVTLLLLTLLLLLRLLPAFVSWCI
jgi:hypothetical protein